MKTLKKYVQAALWSATATLLLAPSSCTKTPSSTTKSIVNADNTKAMGLLPVRRYVSEAQKADPAKLAPGQLWARNQMINGEYFAFIGCTGPAANFWYSVIEDRAERGILLVDESGKISYNETSTTAPDEVKRCQILNHRLLTYPVLEELLLGTATTAQMSRDKYDVMQATYLAIRSSYSPTGANDQLFKTLMLPLARMYQAQKNLAFVDTQKFVDNLLARDPDFVPDACGMTAAGTGKLPAETRAWKNANYLCVPAGGAFADAMNFTPAGGQSFETLSTILVNQIDSQYNPSQATAPRDHLISILTDLDRPLPVNLLAANYGPTYVDASTPPAAGAGLALLGDNRPAVTTRGCPATRAPTARGFTPPSPGSVYTVNGRATGPTVTNTFNQNTVGSSNFSALQAAAGVYANQGSNAGVYQGNSGVAGAPGVGGQNDRGFDPQAQRLLQQVSTGQTGGLATVNYGQGSPFTGVTDPTTHESVVYNSQTRETFVMQTDQHLPGGQAGTGTFIESAPHLGNDTTSPQFVGILNNVQGDGRPLGQGMSAKADLVVGGNTLPIGMTGDAKSGFLYNCPDVRQADTKVNDLYKTGSISQPEYDAAKADIAYMNQHKNNACGRLMLAGNGLGLDDCAGAPSDGSAAPTDAATADPNAKPATDAGAPNANPTGGTVAGGTAGGDTAGGMVAGGTTAGGMVAGGTVAGGTVAGGTTAGGDTAGGAVAGGTTAGGDTLGGTVAGGTTAGGTTAGGDAAGGTTAGGTTAGGDSGAPPPEGG